MTGEPGRVVEELVARYGGGRESVRVASAPGRVNLIGGHTDYNEGHVLPVAIDQRLAAAIRPTDGDEVRVYSLAYDEERRFPVDDIGSVRSRDWLAYVHGVIAVVSAAGYDLGGMEIVVGEGVPIGAGLGSSAAIEVAIGFGLDLAFELGIEPRDLADFARRAEHEYVGVECGILDQYATLFGQRESALAIDCRSGELEVVPFDADQAEIVIVDTNVAHDLAESAYNDRLATCKRAVKLLDSYTDGTVSALRDVDPETFREVEQPLPETVRSRARHVVTENARVEAAVDALRAENYVRLGQLMFESHASLREEYAVSCGELDAVVDIAREADGVLGARMTGGGFGGSVVTLVDPDSVETFRERIHEEYPTRTGVDPDCYVARPDDGCQEISTE